MFRFLTICALIASNAYAVDGVVLIDQNRALAGNVTPGDTAGFPVTISQPGSYRLSGNLTVGTVNVQAIQITVSNVTLDLNGFQVQCTYDASVGFGTGCIASGGTNATAIRNGKIVVTTSGSSTNPVYAGSFGPATIVEQLQVTVAGSGAASGLTSGAHSIFRHNTVSAPFRTSFAVTCPSLVDGNVNQGGGYGEGGTGCTKVNNIGFFGL
jgi:hypothetical protein